MKKHLAYSLVLLIISCKEFENKNNQQKLGQYLFFDTRLSYNNTKSCASCHNPAFAFTDGYRTSATASGDNLQHNAPSLINSLFLKRYDWANPNVTDFYKQIQRPLYNNHPIELGLDKHLSHLQIDFAKDSLYKILFKLAFPKDDSLFTKKQIETALVEYEKTLISNESDFDKNKLSDDAVNGYRLFSNNKLNCINCHPPPYFTIATITNNNDSIYINNGLVNFSISKDSGLYHYTKNKKDIGKFKIPSLRNVMLTAPYMHDGSLASINEVIELYAKGGNKHINQHQSIKGFEITAKEKKDLIEFLYSLTDSSIFYKQQFQNPFHK